jgi:hypothetical protein
VDTDTVKLDHRPEPFLVAGAHLQVDAAVLVQDLQRVIGTTCSDNLADRRHEIVMIISTMSTSQNRNFTS